jgi:AraC-like DNA-binding protein
MQSVLVLPKEPRLRPYIEYFWFLKADGPENSACPPIIYPEANFDLIFSFAAPTVWTARRQRRTLKGSFLLSGLRKEPLLIDCQAPVEYLAVRFRAPGLYPFLALPLEEMVAAQAVELELLPGGDWTELTEKLALITGIPGKIRLLERELLARLDTEDVVRSWLLTNALAKIQISQGALPVQQLHARLGVHPKQLEREFKKYLGVPPKFYSRIIRFTSLLDYLHRQKAEIAWAELAYTFGYVDQSHLIKEFLQFLGYSPEQYLALRKLALADNC